MPEQNESQTPSPMMAPLNVGDDFVVQMEHITKVFPGIVANDDITLQLKRGEIHALLGENGAGKSTLMSVLFGLYHPEGGRIFINGQEVHIKDPNDANRYGIGMVHQHFMLIDCFTGLENIVLGAEPADKLGVIHLKKVRNEIQDLCDKYNFKVDLDAKISDMSVGMQQKVEILKMLYRKNDILIFDEPTAVLTPQEIEELMQSMKGLAHEGKSILFISHKLNEIMEVADRVTVLRRGKCIGTVNVKDTDIYKLSSMMVGRPVQLVVVKDQAKPGKAILSVRNLNVYSHAKHKDVVKDVSFDVHEGEITCLAGIEGNGQTELIYALTGLAPAKSGKIYIRHMPTEQIEGKQNKKNGKAFVDFDITKQSVRKRNEEGMSHIPEDRHRYGLVLDYDLKNNMVLERYYQPEFSSHGWVKFKAIKNYSDRLIKAYDVRSGQGSNSLVRSMSGGNQQKAIVAREMDRGNPLLVACQPTRGLDVGAIEFIHKEIVVQRDQGKAVLLLSLELEEVMNLSDRILVMHEGQIVGDLDPKKVTMEELGLYMSGAKSDVLPPLDPVDMAADEKEDNLEPAAEEKPAEEPQAQKTPEDVKPAAEPAVAKKPSEEAKPEAETVKEEAKPTEEAKPETAAPAKEETAETPSVKETEPAAKPEEEKMDTEAIKPTEDKTEEPKAEEPEQEKPEEAKPAEEVKPAEAVSEEKAPATEEQKPAEPIKAEAKPAPVKEEPKPVETQPAPKKNPVPANFAKKNATPAPVVKKPHKLTKAELKMIRLKNLRQYKGKDEDEIKKEVKK